MLPSGEERAKEEAKRGGRGPWGGEDWPRVGRGGGGGGRERGRKGG